MLINLHLHSNYSDGAASIARWVDIAKKKNHVALILTDHDYYMNPRQFLEQRDEIRTVVDNEGFAIIQGLEVALLYEEILLFGDEACLEWMLTMKTKPTLGVQIEKLKQLKRDHECAMVLCHPNIRWCVNEMQTAGLFKLMDGYEVKNGKKVWPKDSVEWLECLMPHAKQFKNYDAHHPDDFDGETNEIDEYVGTSEELVRWIRRK